MFEAQAIAIEIEKIIPNRPMTHDLFKSFAYSFNFSVKEIIISDLKEGVFFAKIVCSDGIKQVEIDARPSDAIAIGLRFNVPIFTYEAILSEAGIVLSDESEEEVNVKGKGADSPDSKEEKGEEATSGDPKEQYKHYSSEKLNSLLEEALSNEDYERAALIRDEMNRRN